MKAIIIKDESNLIDRDFILAIKRYLPIWIMNYLKNKNSIYSWNEYLSKHVFTGKRKVLVDQAIRIGLDNVKISISKNIAILQIDPNIRFPYYPEYKVIDIISLIDSGNLDMKGLHCVSELFNWIKNDIRRIRESYEMGFMHLIN